MGRMRLVAGVGRIIGGAALVVGRAARLLGSGRLYDPPIRRDPLFRGAVALAVIGWVITLAVDRPGVGLALADLVRILIQTIVAVGLVGGVVRGFARGWREGGTPRPFPNRQKL